MEDRQRRQPEESLLRGLRRTFAAASGYAAARLELFFAEAGAAGVRLGVAFILVLLAAVAIVAGYLVFMAAAALFIARHLGWAVELVLLLIACAHFLIAIASLLGLIPLLRSGLFRESLAQFRKEKEWLEKKTETEPTR